MSRFRVMIVDDDKDLRAIQRMTLSQNYEVVEANDGLDALMKLEWAQPDFIILDVMMPLMDGFEACRAIRNHPGFRDVPILFVTALGQKEAMKEAYGAGANLYMTKPFDPDRVLSVLAHFFKDAAVEPRSKSYTLEQLGKLDTGELPESGVQPAAAGKDEAPAPKPVEEAVATPIPRVMVVSANSDLLKQTSAALKESFEVATARGRLEAIEKVIVNQPDLVVLDANLPDDGAYLLSESLRQNRKYKAAPIVFLVGKVTRRVKDHCQRWRVNETVGLPLDVEELRQTLRKCTEAPGFSVRSKYLTTEVSFPGASEDTE